MMRIALLLWLVLGGCSSETFSCDDCLVLHDVTVIDGRGNSPVEHQVVVIRNGVIASIAHVDEFGDPPANQSFNVSGMYVMPGLVDMHAHVTILPMNEDGSLATRIDREASEEALQTLLDFGITTVRNPAAPSEDGVALREAVSSRATVGPHIRTAGSTLNLGSSRSGPSVSTPTESRVREEVQRQAELGVDYIKVYGSLSPELIAAAIQEAHVHGLEVIGHLQRTTWTAATELGIDHITHGAPWSADYLPNPLRSSYRGTLKDRMFWLENVDLSGPAIREMIEVMADRGVTVDPTLIAYRTKFYGDDPHYVNSPDSIYAPQLVRDIWHRGTFTSDWTAADYARGHAVWPRVLELTKAMYDGGIVLTAGSDLPNPWVIPGVSLHEELRLLHEAGIPPLEVLKIATYNGAWSLGLEERIGSVEVGKDADLIVLRADPSVDLSNTRRIEWVLVDGAVRERLADP